MTKSEMIKKIIGILDDSSDRFSVSMDDDDFQIAAWLYGEYAKAKEEETKENEKENTK